MFQAAFGGPPVLPFMAATPAFQVPPHPEQHSHQHATTPQNDLQQLRRLRDDIVRGLHPLYRVPPRRASQPDTPLEKRQQQTEPSAPPAPAPRRVSGEVIEPVVAARAAPLGKVGEQVLEKGREAEDEDDLDGEEIAPPPTPPPALLRRISSAFDNDEDNDDMDEGESDSSDPERLIVSRLNSPQINLAGPPLPRPTHTRFPAASTAFSLPTTSAPNRPPPPPPPASFIPPPAHFHLGPNSGPPAPPPSGPRASFPKAPLAPPPKVGKPVIAAPSAKKESRGERKDREARELVEKKIRARAEEARLKSEIEAARYSRAAAKNVKRPGSPLDTQALKRSKDAGPPPPPPPFQARPPPPPPPLPRSSPSVFSPQNQSTRAFSLDSGAYRPPPPPPSSLEYRRSSEFATQPQPVYRPSPERRSSGPPPPPPRDRYDERPPPPPSHNFDDRGAARGPRYDPYDPYMPPLDRPRSPPPPPQQRFERRSPPRVSGPPSSSFTSYHPAPPPSLRPLTPPYGHPSPSYAGGPPGSSYAGGRDPYGLPPPQSAPGYGPPRYERDYPAQPYQAPSYRGPPRSPPRDSYSPYGPPPARR